jgi:ABC-type methionine transport system ATPase subunit
MTLRDQQGSFLNPASPVLQMLGADAVAKILMALILRESPTEGKVTITLDDVQRLNKATMEQNMANLVFISNHDGLVVKMANDAEAKVYMELEEQKMKAPGNQ